MNEKKISQSFQGECVYLPKMTSKPAFYQHEVFEELCNKVIPKLAKPPQKAPVSGLSADFPCFTKEDILALYQGTEKEVM